MPKEIINYSSTIIYKIVCKDLNITDVYVGHTTNFIKRKQNHKNDCINPNSKKHNYKVYTTIRDNGGWDNWLMIEVEKYNCNDSNEALARERHWYEIFQAKLNTDYPHRTQKEYCIDNKDKIFIQRQEFRSKNKARIQENKNKVYNCEICGKTYTNCHKSRHERTIFHMSKLK